MRLAVSAVVGVVAGYYGGPAVGFQAFSVTYGLTGGLDPNKKVLGPRLQDLKAPQASYGAVIPYLEGAPRLAGDYIWSSEKREIANTTTEGKGGPGVDSTTFTYEMDVLIELAINECEGLRRIWSNGKLVWSNADDADGETLVAAAQTTSWRDIRFYSGGPGQLPDPTYEAAVGVGNAPAYRTRTTVFIEGLNLGSSGQLPVLTFEVVSQATTDYATTNFATFTLEDAYDTAPFLSGISAMTPDGFDFIYGADYDDFNGGHLGYKVFHVRQDGTVAGAGDFTYGGAVGSGSGKEGNAMQGNADESVLVVYEFDPAFIPSVDHFTMYKTDGSSVQFSFGVPANADAWIFAKRGSRVAIASSTFSGTNAVRIYNATSGALVASATMATNMQFCAIGDGVVYALASDNAETGNDIYVLDLATAALVDTIATPITAVQSSITTDEDGNLYLFALGGIGNEHPVYKWDGSAWTKILNEPLLYAVPGDRHAYYASRGVLALQRFDSSGIAPYREQFYIALNRVGIVPPGLDEVVSRLCLRTGQLEAADIDVTALAPYVVRSMAISQVSTTRATIESLMSAYLFEWAESDKLRAVVRGGASVATIPFDDLGVSEDATAEPLPKKRSNDMEQVARVSVKYANVLNDSQDGLEQADRLVTESSAEAVVEVPLGFTPTEAKRLADANTMDQAVQLIQLGPISLSRKYSHIEVADPFTVVDADGSSFRVRGTKGTISDGVNTFELVLDDATAIVSAAETDESYSSSTLLRLLSDTDLEMLDIPILRDADDALGPYAAVGAGPKWSGAQLDKSTDDTTFAKIGTFTSKTAIGTATTTLGDFDGGSGLFDEANTVTVDVGDSTLSSYSKATVLAGGADGYLIGSELLIACVATLVSPGVYRLSSLLRGQRGTEWAIGGHGASERVVLLQQSGAGLLKVHDESAELNAIRYYRATTIGKSVDDADEETFSDTGVALKPFAPTDLRVVLSSGSRSLEWNRRSRLSGVLFGTVPLGEASERYDVEIRDGSDVVVQSAVDLTVPSYAMSSLLAGDFLSTPGAMFDARNIGGDIVGSTEDSIAGLSAKRVVEVTTGGTHQSASLGQWRGQLTNNGDAIYLVAYEQTIGTVPIFNIAEKVVKLTRGSLGTIDATWTGTLGDFPVGIAHDGTDVWISESGADRLRQLDASTLASIATYPMATMPQKLSFAAGKIWVACYGSDEVARFDVATLSEDLRFSCVHHPFEILVVGSTVFVAGESDIGVYTTAGALVTTHAGLSYNQPFVAIGSQVATFVSSYPLGKVALFNASTGALEALLDPPTPFALLRTVAGADGSDLIVSGSRYVSGGSYEVRRYTIAPADLAGYTAFVWQKSAAVGRGYPASLEL